MAWGLCASGPVVGEGPVGDILWAEQALAHFTHGMRALVDGEIGLAVLQIQRAEHDVDDPLPMPTPREPREPSPDERRRQFRVVTAHR